MAPLSVQSLQLVAHLAELVSARRVSNDQPAKPAVADEDVGAEPENEVGYTGFSRAASTAFASASADVASKNRSAGPPILNVV